MYILHPTVIYVESNVTRSLLKKENLHCISNLSQTHGN